MAQHIEIRNEKAPKILQKIGASIEKEVAKGLSKGSFKWRYLGDEAKKWFNSDGSRVDTKEYEGVWLTNRYIGKGIVFGDTRGDFEVHTEGKLTKAIYLVA